MDSYRLFIDLPLEPTLASQVLHQFANLDLPWAKLKKTLASDLHLTLKFLGDTPLTNLEDIIQVLKEIKVDFRDIALTLAGPKIFNEKNPRLLALALLPNKKLTLLYNAIENGLWQAGLATRENRGFVPHLTLARVKQNATLEEFKNFIQWRPAASNFNVTYFELQDSVLTARGPHYTVLQTFDL